MRLTHLTSQDYVVSHWSGGKTIQVAIAPKGAVYADRDFLWRVSSATADLDESDYTPLPDYQRWLSVFDQPIRLQHDGAATHSWGRCVDFNLMLRKGKAEGDLQALSVTGESLSLSAQGADTLLLYCSEGSGSVYANGETVELKAEEALLIEDPMEEGIALTGEGRFMLARMKG